MKVSEYHKQGLKNFVEEEPQGYVKLGEAKEGVHRVACYVKYEDDKIVDAKFTASKRCKKLLAIADYVCEQLKEGRKDITKEEILQFFKEEKDKEKLKARFNLVKKAAGL